MSWYTVNGVETDDLDTVLDAALAKAEVRRIAAPARLCDCCRCNPDRSEYAEALPVPTEAYDIPQCPRGFGSD
jgi:hypothetical protein